MPPYLRYATEKQAEIVAFIRKLVECESASDSPSAVNRLVDLLVEQTSEIASAELIPVAGFGKHLRLEFKLPGGGDTQLLALGHSDTVWPLGTLENMPFREVDGRLWGPGVLDMKAGLAFFIYAMRALRELNVPAPHKVVLLVVSDEEVGSPSSRPLTEAQARLSQSVLVLEPGTGLTGKLKTARKGVGGYSIFVEGKAAHAGVDFPNGANAIVEAAHQVIRVAEFTDLARGTTVNPGLIRGGTRTNVIAAQARVDVDIRVARLSDAFLLEEKFHALKPVDSRCTLRVEGGLNRPPMERTAAIEELFLQARELGAAMDVVVEESSTGGGSDGNFTAALGVPTLDGLGAVGEGAHASNESILVDRIADRVALLAGLVAGGCYTRRGTGPSDRNLLK
jgi:glutamate carboxypeptidase